MLLLSSLMTLNLTQQVISPDPFIHTKEVGVPDVSTWLLLFFTHAFAWCCQFIAKTLTYSEPVTPHNSAELRQGNSSDLHTCGFDPFSHAAAVINGPHVHPGANAVIGQDDKVIDLDRLNETQVRRCWPVHLE